MEARSFTVASILILMAIASSEGAAPVEQKIAPIAPVSKSASIYQSHYEAPIETSGEEIEDGADDVFDMLLQVEAAPAKKKAPAAKKAAPKKAAPKAKAAAKPKAAPKAATHKEGAEPVKAHKFQTKASKQVTVLEETPEEDDDEPEPEDDSFDRDEPIGAGAGDFVEEGDDEMAEEFQADQKAAHIEPKPPAKLEVIEEDAPKAAPAPVSIGLKSDKGATIALAESKSTSQNYAKRRAQVSFAAPRRARYGGEDGFTMQRGNIINPAMGHVMKREEYQESQTRLKRRAQRNTLLAAYKKLEFAGDTKEEKYQRKIHADNAEIVLDEIQGINPDTGRREQWMAKNPVDED